MKKKAWAIICPKCHKKNDIVKCPNCNTVHKFFIGDKKIKCQKCDKQISIVICGHCDFQIRCYLPCPNCKMNYFSWICFKCKTYNLAIMNRQGNTCQNCGCKVYSIKCRNCAENISTLGLGATDTRHVLKLSILTSSFISIPIMLLFYLFINPAYIILSTIIQLLVLINAVIFLLVYYSIRAWAYRASQGINLLKYIKGSAICKISVVVIFISFLLVIGYLVFAIGTVAEQNPNTTSITECFEIIHNSHFAQNAMLAIFLWIIFFLLAFSYQTKLIIENSCFDCWQGTWVCSTCKTLKKDARLTLDKAGYFVYGVCTTLLLKLSLQILGITF